jgi:hypothetical protein
MEALMRAHRIIFVLAALLIGLGAKQYFYPQTVALADINVGTGINVGAGINVLQMELDGPGGTLPSQKIHDMTLVFDEE